MRRVLGLALVTVLATGTCGGGAGHPKHSPNSTQQSPSPQPTPSGPVPAGMHSVIQPGTYFTPHFVPRMTFTIGEPWWVEDEEPTAVVLTPGTSYRNSENMVFVDVERVFAPSNQRRVVAAPKDLLGWFLHHPGLKVVMKPRTVEVGGVRATEFDVNTLHAPPCTGGGGHCWLITPFRPGDPFSPDQLAGGPPVNRRQVEQPGGSAPSATAAPVPSLPRTMRRSQSIPLVEVLGGTACCCSGILSVAAA